MSQIDNSARVAQVAQFPDRRSYDAGVAANDNAALTALSRENLLAESVLSKIDLIDGRLSLATGLIFVAVLASGCIAVILTRILARLTKSPALGGPEFRGRQLEPTPTGR